ncbi:MAG: class I SAM-dependent methyltransferase [Thermoleophilaceae bacterium]|nr:class I SAM-dependent methyltransferase [Thermoleophilaceae bacterium]
MSAGPGPRFAEDRPANLRTPPRWHRLSHIAGLLPRELEALAAGLGVPPDGRVLDYGCADAPYRHFFPAGVEYIAADIPGNPHATATIAPDGTVDVPDASVDCVLSTQVLEHVADPAVYLSECARVLRPGGGMLLSTHGIMVFHPDPVDLWRWTGEGLRHVVEQAGLEVERLEGIMGLGATGLQLFQDALLWRLRARLRAPVAWLLQRLVALAERLDDADTRRLNALVFAVVARKP